MCIDREREPFMIDISTLQDHIGGRVLAVRQGLFRQPLHHPGHGCDCESNYQLSSQYRDCTSPYHSSFKLSVFQYVYILGCTGSTLRNNYPEEKASIFRLLSTLTSI